MLTFAVPKGRMFAETLRCLNKIDIELPDFDPDSRKLIFYDKEEKFKFVLVKPYDVTTYVEYGAAELGVAGKDIIEEREANVYEPLDLGFSKCRLSVARPRDFSPGDRHPRIATEFTNLAEKHFTRQGENVEIIKLHGSVELAPRVGLAGRIVDIVSSGRTLERNNLVEEEIILRSSARLIVNRPAMKLHRQKIRKFIDQLKKVI